MVPRHLPMLAAASPRIKKQRQEKRSNKEGRTTVRAWIQNDKLAALDARAAETGNFQA